MTKLCFVSPPECETQDWKDGKDGWRFEFKYEKDQIEILNLVRRLQKEGWKINFDEFQPTGNTPVGYQRIAFYIDEDCLNGKSN